MLDFGHTFSNRTHFRACGRFWSSSVQRARRVADENKKIEEDRIAVKPKSADNYVVRPNNYIQSYHAALNRYYSTIRYNAIMHCDRQFTIYSLTSVDLSHGYSSYSLLLTL